MIHQLLAAEDSAFLPAAYVSILSRQLDDAGAAYYSQMLGAGVHRVRILDSIANSREGRDGGVKVAGLAQRALIARMSRIWLLGGLVEALFPAWSDSDQARRYRSMRMQIESIHREISEAKPVLPRSSGLPLERRARQMKRLRRARTSVGGGRTPPMSIDRSTRSVRSEPYRAAGREAVRAGIEESVDLMLANPALNEFEGPIRNRLEQLLKSHRYYVLHRAITRENA